MGYSLNDKVKGVGSACTADHLWPLLSIELLFATERNIESSQSSIWKTIHRMDVNKELYIISLLVGG